MSRARRRATVVVVGAGAIGLAVALQLRRGGVPDVLVVDRNPSPGMGSTSRANGGVRAQFSTPINVDFSRFTIAGLADLDAMSAGQVGLRRIGYLFMTGTAAGVASLARGFDVQRSLGLDVVWLTPADVADRVPFVDSRGLRGGTYCASDGVIDPHGVVGALWSEGRRQGVGYIFDCDVAAIEHSAGRARLHTTSTIIDADHVVNAAGPFAQELAARAGLDLPVLPYRRNLACTEPAGGAPDVIPMCVDVDTGVLVRREARGFLIGYSNPHDASTFEISLDPAFLADVGARIGNRFGFLEQAPINARKCWAGLYPETPDHHAIIDAPSDAPWFVQCAGFGGHGIMHSLAAGQAVTELIRDGRCATFDLNPLRLHRFQGGITNVETAVL